MGGDSRSAASGTVPGNDGAEQQTGRTRGGAIAVVVGAVLWLAVLAVGIGYAILLQLLGSARCEPYEGSSTYGDPGWSILPPGPTCTFTVDVHGFDQVRGPTPVMSIWLAVLLVGGVALVASFRRVRRARR